MPHILIVDDNEVARLALNGILSERGHTATFASGTGEAWRTLHELDQVDLLVVELKLKNEQSAPFIQRIRSNAAFRELPVLVYTSVSDLSIVRSVLSLKPQNYLLKPYRGDLVHHEIEKALTTAWTFVPPDDHFAASSGMDVSTLLERRLKLGASIKEFIPVANAVHDSGSGLRTLPKLKVLTEESEGLGIHRITTFLKELVTEAEGEHWWSLKECCLTLEYSARVLSGALGLPGGISASDGNTQPPPRDLAFWQSAEASGGFPLKRDSIQAELDALSGCPVIDTIAASFVMSAEGSRSSLSHLNDLVCQDPCLAATVLMSANKLAREGDLNAIEDPEMAVGMLGDVKMVALARSIPQISERSLNLAPFSWAQYRLFQLGVARVSEFVRVSMDLGTPEGVGRTAGLLHDLGQLLIMRIFPHGFSVMVKFAADRGLTIEEAQRHFLGTTGGELAGPFFWKLGMPARFCSVIEHAKTPAASNGHDAELVASVALARHICKQNGLGFSGDHRNDSHTPLEQTEAWKVLSERVYPSFQIGEFQQKASALCTRLKESLYVGGYSKSSKAGAHHHMSARQDPWRH